MTDEKQQHNKGKEEIKSRFKIGFEGVQRGILSEREGKVIPCRGLKTEKAREPTVESPIQ